MNTAARSVPGLLSPTWPTFLLIAASAATLRAQNATDEEIKATLDKARPELLTLLGDANPTMYGGGQLGLLCLAALHDGVPADDKVLRRSLERLSKARLDGTYALSLRLLVAEACPELPKRKSNATADARELLRHRFRGAFHYQARPGAWDLSNTQYAALGLRAAASLGVDVPDKVWWELADAVGTSQADSGGFGYAGPSGETASMTVAGICVLEICRQHPGIADELARTIDGQVKKAWSWLDANAAFLGNANLAWSLYCHYGLERAGILSDVTTVGGADWYRRGARMLVDTQRPGGGWRVTAAMFPGAPEVARGDPVDTAFAVLFLRRRFQKVPGPVTGTRAPTLESLDAKADDAAVTACAAELARRGKAAVPDLLAALRSDVAPRRRAAVRALTAIAGKDFGIDPERPFAEVADAVRRAELWYLENR